MNMPNSVMAIPRMAMTDSDSSSMKYAANAVKMGAEACIRTVRLGPMVTYAAKRPKSPMPSPIMPLRPTQSHWPLFASGRIVPSSATCAAIRSPMAIVVRMVFTLNAPNFLPAEVKKRLLAVQRQDVRIAADSPIVLGFKFFTFV